MARRDRNAIVVAYGFEYVALPRPWFNAEYLAEKRDRVALILRVGKLDM
jgi:hypothetical protein